MEFAHFCIKIHRAKRKSCSVKGQRENQLFAASTTHYEDNLAATEVTCLISSVGLAAIQMSTSSVTTPCVSLPKVGVLWKRITIPLLWGRMYDSCPPLLDHSNKLSMPCTARPPPALPVISGCLGWSRSEWIKWEKGDLKESVPPNRTALKASSQGMQGRGNVWNKLK